MRPEPIILVRLDSEHAQVDGKSVNRGLRVLDPAMPSMRQRSRFLMLTKRIAASEDVMVTSLAIVWRYFVHACFVNRYVDYI